MEGIYLGEGFEPQGCDHGTGGGTHVSCPQLPVAEESGHTWEVNGSRFQGHAKSSIHEGWKAEKFLPCYSVDWSGSSDPSLSGAEGPP